VALPGVSLPLVPCASRSGNPVAVVPAPSPRPIALRVIAAGRLWLRADSSHKTSCTWPFDVSKLPQNSVQFMITRPRQTSLLRMTLTSRKTASAPQTGQTIDSGRSGSTLMMEKLSLGAVRGYIQTRKPRILTLLCSIWLTLLYATKRPWARSAQILYYYACDTNLIDAE
jgi:hypothetical protein